MRRRRRFQMPSRAHLRYAFSALEGLVALLLCLPLFALYPALPAAVLALAASTLYGFFASAAASKFLTYADTRQPFVLHAAVSWLGAAGFALLLALALFGGTLTLGTPLWTWLLGAAAVLAGVRFAICRQLASMLYDGRLQIERVAIIGEADAVRRFQREARIWRQGSQVVASFMLEGSLADAPPAAQAVTSFVRDSVSKHCKHLLLVGELTDLNAIDSIVRPCRPFAINLMLCPTPAGNGQQPRMLDIVPLGQVDSVRVLSIPLDETGRALKRAFDIVGAGLGLVVLSPVLLMVAAAIRLTSPGPALYRQERRGFNGGTFMILKFRSMTVMEDGRAMAQARENDPRVTAVGRFIRRTSIDELPQLINVLKGEMSLVGPRPHAILHDDEMNDRFDLYAQRQRLRPGITGWAQVNGYRGDTSTLAKIEGRTMHDLYYAANWSLLFDCSIILLTLFSRRTRQNAL